MYGMELKEQIYNNMYTVTVGFIRRTRTTGSVLGICPQYENIHNSSIKITEKSLSHKKKNTF